jgi:transcriptional regulator with PAS, ATPase and Fis domain
MKVPSAVSGLVVADNQGRVVFSAGYGKDARVTSLIADREWRSDAVKRRIVALELDNRKVVMIWTSVESFNLAVIVPNISNSVFEFTAAVDFAWDIIEHLITDPFNAMTVVDDEARVVFISPVHEGFFGLEHGEAIGRRVRDVIENTKLDRVIRTGKAEVGDVQRMRGQERVVNRTPIFHGDQLVGAIGRVMFKGPEQVHALNSRLGALEKELDFYKRETQALRRETSDRHEMIGKSDAIRRLKDDIERIAPLDVPVLILGESGTGKELVAHSIHRLSSRKSQRMVIVNSAALPATLVESELFGYEPGTFTGADRKGRRGRFEQAEHSTLFLDEVGDMPLDVQAKLLRVLQDKAVQRIGSETSREADFRLIAATNRDLESQMSKQDFRLDFYYRISPITLTVPPLRERLEDIPLLVQHFLSEFAARHHRPAAVVDPAVYAYLSDLSWPGNIRQLRHVVERAVIFCEGSELTVDNFRPRDLLPPVTHTSIVMPAEQPSADKRGLHNMLDQVETKLIREALARNKGNKKRVAEELGISRSYLYKKLGVPEPG